MAIPLRPFDVHAPILFGFDWWRLFQKRVVCIDFDIYVLFHIQNIRNKQLETISILICWTTNE